MLYSPNLGTWGSSLFLISNIQIVTEEDNIITFSFPKYLLPFLLLPSLQNFFLSRTSLCARNIFQLYWLQALPCELLWPMERKQQCNMYDV